MTQPSLLSILLVEDDEPLRELIGMMLEADGREVVACANAEDALVHWQQRRFDVLFTDATLPGMSGHELIAQVVADQPLQWVVLCSGLLLDRDQSALGRHVRPLMKPFDIEQLDALMNDISQAIR